MAALLKRKRDKDTASRDLFFIPLHLDYSLSTCSLWQLQAVLQSQAPFDPYGMPAAVRVDILELSARRNVFFFKPPYGVSLKGMMKKKKRLISKKEAWQKSVIDAILHHINIKHFGGQDMTRASISITPPNDAWIKSQIKSEEFSSRSDVVNDLIRKARKEGDEILAIRAALIEGEESGTSSRTPDEIMQAVIERKRKNGTL